MSWTRVARLEDLKGAGPHATTAEGVELVVLQTPSGPRVYEGRCPHRGALLGEGELENGTLTCLNHGWQFDAETGERLGGPQCLRVCPVREEAGALFVDVSALARDRQLAPGTRGIADLPGPRGIPLLGNALQLSPDQMHLQLEQWAAEYGPLYTIRLGPRPHVVVSDVALVSEIMRARPETWRRIGRLEPIFAELGCAGVFTSEGAAWRPLRKLSMRALSHRHLKSFYPTVEVITERLHHRWKRAAAAGEVVDLVEDLRRFAVDVTTLLTLGHDPNSIDSDDDVIQRNLEVVFPTVSRRLNSVVPYWRWFRLPADRRVDSAVAEVQAWLHGLVEQARSRLESDPARAERPANFIEAMIAARDDQDEPFPDDTIVGNAMTILLGGEETTAFSIAWAVHHLCESPETVEALRREVDEQLGDNPIPRDFRVANGLVWPGAIANEAMRLRHLTPIQGFEANLDTSLGDVAVPKGTAVFALLRPSAIDEKNFTDAKDFRPERWVSDEPGRKHEISAHMPFGTGPRICPGRSLALLESRLVLATLYKNFVVARVGDSDAVAEKLSFVLMPSDLRVRLESRSRA